MEDITCWSVKGLTLAIFCDSPKPPSLRLPFSSRRILDGLRSQYTYVQNQLRLTVRHPGTCYCNDDTRLPVQNGCAGMEAKQIFHGKEA